MCIESKNSSKGWFFCIAGKGEVLHNIDETNRHYGGAGYPDATQTIFLNGEVDP